MKQPYRYNLGDRIELNGLMYEASGMDIDCGCNGCCFKIEHGCREQIHCAGVIFKEVTPEPIECTDDRCDSDIDLCGFSAWNIIGILIVGLIAVGLVVFGGWELRI